MKERDKPRRSSMENVINSFNPYYFSEPRYQVWKDKVHEMISQRYQREYKSEPNRMMFPDMVVDYTLVVNITKGISVEESLRQAIMDYREELQYLREDPEKQEMLQTLLDQWDQNPQNNP